MDIFGGKQTAVSVRQDVDELLGFVLTIGISLSRVSFRWIRRLTDRFIAARSLHKLLALDYDMH